MSRPVAPHALSLAACKLPKSRPQLPCGSRDCVMKPGRVIWPPLTTRRVVGFQSALRRCGDAVNGVGGVWESKNLQGLSMTPLRIDDALQGIRNKDVDMPLIHRDDALVRKF